MAPEVIVRKEVGACSGLINDPKKERKRRIRREREREKKVREE